MDIIPFRFLIEPNTPRNGFLFGNNKGPWETEKITKVLVNESTKMLGFRLTMADYRHISVAIDRKFIRGIDLELTEDDDEDDPHDLMAAHRTRTAINRYGRQAGLLQKLTTESMEIFGDIADKGHRWLELVSRMPRGESDFVRHGQDRVDAPINERLQVVLRQMYGIGATFKGKQEEALEAVVKDVTPLLICLPTGRGKSLMFMLPALMKGSKTTVVITPRVALGDDILRRCKEANISSFIYGKSRPREAKIMIVVTETATSSRFSQAILDLHLEEKLDRIVVEEAHELVTKDNYRPKFEDVKRLLQLVQSVFITATMPPSLIPEFQKRMLIESIHEVREASYKKNFCYGVQVYEGEDFEEGCVDMISEMVDRYEEEEKVQCYGNDSDI